MTITLDHYFTHFTDGMEVQDTVADVLDIDDHVKQSMLDKVREVGRFWHGC